MSNLDEALRALAGPRLSIHDAERSNSLASTGLYAVYGSPSVWQQLGLGQPPDDRPLYVGKSESSFQSRDINGHFGDGGTGQSTLRRSFAALLASQLGLVPIPRGTDPLNKTERADKFGLSPEHDARLTLWMRDNLTLALWPYRVVPDLGTSETEVIVALRPPLCLNKWRPNTWHTDLIKPARANMRAIVRSAP